MKSFFSQYKTCIKNIIILGLAYLTGISLAMLNGVSVTSIDVLLPCLMGLSYLVYNKSWELIYDASNKDMEVSKLLRKDMISSLVVGFIFALTMVVGVKIDFYNNEFHDFGMMDIVIYPFLGLFFSSLVLLLFQARDLVVSNAITKQSRESKQNVSANRFVKWVVNHIFMSLWIINLIAYFPYFLTFFPGNAGNDTWLSVAMILGEEPWTNHHPVLFTGLLMIIIKGTAFLNSLTISIGIFSFLQMVSFAAVMAYLESRICKMNVIWPVKAFAVCMSALHPFMGMYSVYLTKDVIFAEIMILLCLKIYDLVEAKGEMFGRLKECFKIGLLFLLSCMLRNNGMYISIVMAAVFICLYKKYWKQIFVVFVCVIGLFQIWTGPVFQSIGIEKQSFAEAASIPLQQIGYVLWEGKEFSKEDMAFLEELMPVERVKEVYTPGLTDPYKFDEEFNDDFLNDNIPQFLTVWWHGCQMYFPEYVEAYLSQTLGYWFYGATNTVCTQGVVENAFDVEQVDLVKQAVGVSFEPIFEKAVLAGRKAPIICILGSMAMQMLMIVFVILQYLRGKQSVKCVYLIPLIILWGTIMIATPARCLLRYLFPIFTLWPFLLAEFFAGSKEA